MRNVVVENARAPLIAVEWRLIAFLWFCYLLNHADRQVVYTLFPTLQKSFGFSNAVLGLTGALFLWVYGLFSRASWPWSSLVVTAPEDKSTGGRSVTFNARRVDVFEMGAAQQNRKL